MVVPTQRNHAKMQILYYSNLIYLFKHNLIFTILSTYTFTKKKKSIKG